VNFVDSVAPLLSQRIDGLSLSPEAWRIVDQAEEGGYPSRGLRIATWAGEGRDCVGALSERRLLKAKAGIESREI